MSSYRATQQDIHDSRTELRVFLQRLSVLPKENVELMKKYDPLTFSQLTGYITGETVLLANQAVEVMNRIPKHVSAVEYITVATALMANGNAAAAERLLIQRRR